jgi:hypothetical protein
MMRCALQIPDAPPLAVDSAEPAVRASVGLDWPGRKTPLRVDALVDTGCPVDFIASPRLANDLRGMRDPTRVSQVQWGGPVACEVYEVAAKLADWISIEVHVPLTQAMEDLLGLPAILRSNLCIRGLSGSAYWASLPDGSGREWITRDADREGREPTRHTPTAPTRLTRGTKPRRKA